MKRTKAFTLVELLVVIGVIAVLIGMLLPALNRARESAKEAACGNNVRQIAMACTLYMTANKGWLVPNKAATQGFIDIAGAGGRNHAGALLVAQKFLPGGQVFYSPSESVTYRIYDDYDKQWRLLYETGTINSLPAAQLVLRTSYVFREPISSAVNWNQATWNIPAETVPYQFHPEKLGKNRMSLISDRFIEDYVWSFHRGKSLLSKVASSKNNGTGWHVGFSDGSVVFVVNDSRVYKNGNTEGAAYWFNDRHKNWTYWERITK